MTIEKLLFELNASSILTKDAVTKRPLNSLELNFQGQFEVNPAWIIQGQMQFLFQKLNLSVIF